MPIKTKLEEDLKDAMRSGDTVRRSVIRLIRSAIKNEEISLQKDLGDEDILKVLNRQVKQRHDSIEAFTQGNRLDMVQKEQDEVSVILEYLPKQLSTVEITDLVKKKIREIGAEDIGDIGRVMSQMMPELQGKASGKDVKDIAEKFLKQ